jgi:DNA modification methylase
LNVVKKPGASGFARGRPYGTAKEHPAVFPCVIPDRFMLLLADRDEWTLDPFAGAGTIFISAEKQKRKALGIEIDPIYCDVIVDRWQRFTGKKATRPAREE